jgi:8-oxo-dGTP diphosphatase
LSPAIEVVAGLIERPGPSPNAPPEVLLSQRLPGRHLAGCWEFPGGKREANEPLTATLARELKEELGIVVDHCSPLLSLTHQYPSQRVRLWVFSVRWSGTPMSCEGQSIRWVSKTDLAELDMPAADAPIVKVVSAPPRYAISPAWQSDQGYVEAWTAMLEAGHRLLQWRPGPSLPDKNRHALARQCGALARAYGALWLINGCPSFAQEVGADGVHLTAGRLRALTKRPEGLSWVAASCHDELELSQAGALGLDFVTVSPVQATASHPGATPLGWAGLARLVAVSPLPVMALGGLSPADLEVARHHGAYGVAGISGFAGGEWLDDG